MSVLIRFCADVCDSYVVSAAWSISCLFASPCEASFIPALQLGVGRYSARIILPLRLYTHTTILRPFVWDYPGGPVPEETFTHSHLKRVVGVCHHFGILWRVEKIIEASALTIQMDAISPGPWMPTPPLFPPVLCRMPFLPQPSQFIPAWDRHQICWIAYL